MTTYLNFDGSVLATITEADGRFLVNVADFDGRPLGQRYFAFDTFDDADDYARNLPVR